MNRYIIDEYVEQLRTRPNNTRKVLNIKKKNGAELSVADIRQVHELVLQKNGNNTKRLLFIAQGIDKRYSLNSYDSNDLNLLDEDEYSRGKVADNSKFSYFFNLQVVISD